MNEKVLVSVIVPVYNIQDYLKKCVDSILNQDFENIEIIIVNDGSTDNSFNIINSNYSGNDKIRIINQENQGLSCSRNNGLKEAIGRYVAFIDGDDWIESNMIREMYCKAIKEDADVVCCRLQYEKGDNRFVSGRDYTTDLIENKDLLFNVFYGRNIQTSAAIKLYRREWLIDNNIFFKPKAINEDAIFIVRVAYYANKIALINKPFYHAIERSNSISRSFSWTIVEHLLFALDDQKDFLQKKQVYDNYVEVYNSYRLKSLTYILFQAAQYLSYNSYVEIRNNLEKRNERINLSINSIKYLSFKINICLFMTMNRKVHYIFVRFLNKLGIRLH